MRAQLISDQELVSRYLQGNEEALEVLVERHKDRVYSYVMMMLKDRQLADDVFQDTFIKVINTLKSGRYNEEGKFLPWMMRIAHNLVIDHFRRGKRMPIADGGKDFDILDTVSSDGPNVVDTMVETQIHSELRALIEELPEDQKTVLKMRHYCEMSFKEIAEETNVSINTALGRMRYALINLRKMIAEKNLNLTIS